MSDGQLFDSDGNPIICENEDEMEVTQKGGDMSFGDHEEFRNELNKETNFQMRVIELETALAQMKAQSAFDKIEIEHQIASVKGLEAALASANEEIERLKSEHCKDCCCARSWKALGVTDYTGKDIPEHITELRSRVEALKAECERLDRANWKSVCASEVFRELKHGKFRRVMLLLQNGQISVGKAAQSIAEIASGITALLPDMELPEPLEEGGCWADEAKSLHSQPASVEKERNALKAEHSLCSEAIEGFKAELSRYQESEFHPDWSLLKATRASLNEHQEEIRRLSRLLDDAKMDAEGADAQRIEIKAERDALREGVKKLELSSEMWNGYSWVAACPGCSSTKRGDHKPDCWLAALLEGK